MPQRAPGEILQDFGYTRYVLLEEQYGEDFIQHQLTEVCFARNEIIITQFDLANQQVSTIRLTDDMYHQLIDASKNYVGHITEMAAPGASTTQDDGIPEVLEDHPF